MESEQDRHRRDSLSLREEHESDGGSSVSASDGLFSRPPSPRSDIPSFFDKIWTQYSTITTYWVKSSLSAVPIPQGFGLSRRHKLLTAWTAFFLVFILLIRTLFLAPKPYVDGITVSGFGARGHNIPSKIWQVMFVNPHNDSLGHLAYDFDPSLLPYTNSWLACNPDWQYTLVGTEGASRFVRQHFSHDERILNVHFGLRNHGAQSDFMRYLLLLVEGGVYSDTDVTCIKPIDEWIPSRWRQQVRAVVGIEGDSRGEGVIGGMLWDVQFGQWTVAAVPGHRLFHRMVDNVINRLEALCIRKNTTINQLAMTDIELLNGTGTALWSETIFHELQLIDPSLKEPLDLTGMKEARLYGDIMVLPIDGIGSGVPHSGATNDGTVPNIAVVQHHFHGSWRNTEGIEGSSEEE